MNYTDNSYVTMLLTMALSPDREEYARPYSVSEYRVLEAKVRKSQKVKSLGAMLGMDISGMMMYLDMQEDEAYRAYTLLNRGVQLSYAMDGFMRQGIDVVTCCDDEYPQRLRSKLLDAAPPAFYRCGNAALLDGPAIAILGTGGTRTGNDVREAIGILVDGAVRHGYTVITGGEPGVCRYAEGKTAQAGGKLVDVLGGGFSEHIHSDEIAAMIASDRAATLCLEHPEAMFTTTHAIARSRLLFALADAAFVFNTDGRRGELEAIQSRTCDWIYAWPGCDGCRTLISRGAIPMNDLSHQDFDDLSRHWSTSRAEQLNMFDLF